MDYDVARVRACFPALADGTAYFDGPGGSQVPRQVADAVAATMTGGISNRGTVTASERRAEEVVVGARAAMADLLGCDPGGVVFGRSMTQLTFDLARALAKTLGARRRGRRHPARPRRQHPAVEARRRRPRHRRALGRVRHRDRASCSVDPAVLSDRTRLVAVTGASNLLGTRPDLAGIAARGARGGRPAVRRRRAPHPARAGRRSATSAPTSTPARPTSSSARTSACSPPTRRCWSWCTRTSCCPPPTRCPSGSSSARCPTSCSPAPPPRWTSSPTWRPGGPWSGAAGCWSPCSGSRPTRRSCSSGCWPGSTRSTGCAARPPRPAYADGAVLGRGPRGPGGARAAGRAPA